MGFPRNWLARAVSLGVIAFLSWVVTHEYWLPVFVVLCVAFALS